MGIVTVPSFGADPVSITGPTLDAKVDGLATEFNGSIDNDNIKSAAAIANSKLNLAAITQNIAHSGTMTHSGVVTMTAKDFTEAKGADVASATTTTIWVTDGNYIHITGTTTITSFGTAGQAGDERTVVFDGILTLTHNATSLILPGGANITTAAGDRAIVRAETTANARVVAYIKADGTAIVGTAFTPSTSNALSGSVIQHVTTKSSAYSSLGSTATPIDDTIPTITEGNALSALDTAITPSNSSNTLIIIARVNISTAGATHTAMALFQDATSASLNTTSNQGQDSSMITYTLIHTMTAGTTSATTFRLRAGTAAGNAVHLNGTSNGGARLFGGVAYSSLTILEIKA